MTIQQYNDFRDKFKSIVYIKGLIKANRTHISRLYAFDKNGSHANAIERAMKKRDALKKELDNMLAGFTYEQWKETSKKMSLLMSKTKSGSENRKRNGQIEFSEFNISLYLHTSEEKLNAAIEVCKNSILNQLNKSNPK